MKKIILIVLCMMCIIGTASAYQFYLSCPASVQVGIPLKCSIDSNFPAGTTFDVAMYQSGYTATPVKSQTMTIQENNPTQYSILDTKGLPGGQYKVEIDFMGNDEGRLSTDSITLQLPVLIDRTGEITITSPMTQALVDALRIEGYITKIGNDGVQIEVRGPDGDSIFGPKWIGTTELIQSGAGEFTQKVPVIKPGQYDVYFKDQKSLYRGENIHRYRSCNSTDNRSYNNGSYLPPPDNSTCPPAYNHAGTSFPPANYCSALVCWFSHRSPDEKAIRE